MSTSFSITEVPLVLLMALAYLGCLCAIIHALIALLARRHHHVVGRALIWEGALVVHTSAMADFILTLRLPAAQATAVALTWQSGLLWLNWVCVGMGIYLFVHARQKSISYAAEVVLLALCTPQALELLGSAWLGVLGVDICFFLVRSVIKLWQDWCRVQENPSMFSLVDTLNNIPVGILITDGSGGSSFMNAAMRAQLDSFKFPTDLGNLTDVWERAYERRLTAERLGFTAAELQASPVAALTTDTEENRMLISADDEQVLLVVRDHTADRPRKTRVFSFDVSALMETTRRLARANAALEQTSRELRSQLDDIRTIAQRATYLRMRARVHDIIGQRLSILQRYLEREQLDSASLEELNLMISSIRQDLRGDVAGDVMRELEAVVGAFALADVNITLEGDLPESERAARVFVDIIREAATNACRHAHAQLVDVRLSHEPDEDGGSWQLVVTNDGVAPEELGPEGMGIRGMRSALAELGGTLTIAATPRFSVCARIPMQGGHYA